MKTREILSKLKTHLDHLKKQNITPSSVRTMIRIKALIAYYKGSSLDEIARCYDVSEKSVKEWIKRFEKDGLEGLNDEERSGRPPKLPAEKLEELKEIIEKQNQRIWVARHVYVLLVTTFGVVYAVKYIPQLLDRIGLSYHKAVHNLIKKIMKRGGNGYRRNCLKSIVKRLKRGGEFSIRMR